MECELLGLSSEETRFATKDDIDYLGGLLVSLRLVLLLLVLLFFARPLAFVGKWALKVIGRLN